jgi:hypothetical protein
MTFQSCRNHSAASLRKRLLVASADLKYNDPSRIKREYFLLLNITRQFRRNSAFFAGVTAITGHRFPSCREEYGTANRVLLDKYLFNVIL